MTASTAAKRSGRTNPRVMVIASSAWNALLTPVSSIIAISAWNALLAMLDSSGWYGPGR